MKKIHLIAALFISLFLTTICSSFIDYPDNPPNGYTGSGPATCGNCHSGGNFGANVVITGVPTSIAPNTTYAISVTAAKTMGSTKKAGFQLNVLNGAGTSTGTLASTSGNVRIESGYAEQAESSSAQNFVSASGPAVKTWTFNWTSPNSSASSTINFYACTVIGNGASGTSGDQVALGTATGTLSSASVPLTVTQIAKTNVTCFGGSNGTAAVSASGGSGCTYTYVWSNGQNTQTVSGLTAGTYTVTATCGASSGTTTVTITQPATALTLSTTGSTISCAGANNGTVSAIASGGGSSYTYLWSNNQTGSMLTNLTAGTYTVTATDNNGCTQSKQAVVSNPINSVTAFTSSTAATCATAGTATVNAANGTAPYTYLWSNGQATATATGLTPNTYSVTVTDNTGCKTTASAVVSSNASVPPSAISGISTITCAQPSGILTAPSGNFNYKWSTGESNASISINNAGNYSLTVTDKSNGCTSSSSKSISSNTTPPTVAISGNTNLTCTQPTSTLTASGGNSYKWSGPGIVSGANVAAVTINAAGTYNVTATNSSNGCTGTAMVKVNESSDKPLLSTSAGTITCKDSIVDISVTVNGNTAGLTYKWTGPLSFIGSKATEQVTIGGDYLLTVTASNGCSSIATVSVKQNKAIPVATIESSKLFICEKDTLTLTANGGTITKSYLWSDKSTSSSIKVQSAGFYQVSVTGENGCIGKAALQINEGKSPVIEVAADSLTCSFKEITPRATITWDSPVLPLWTGPNGFSSTVLQPTIMLPGAYTIQVNPANGCSALKTLVIKENKIVPQIEISGTTFSCDSTPIVLKASSSANNYFWKGFGVDTKTSPTVSAARTGRYICLTQGSNGCIGADSTDVVIQNPPFSIDKTKSVVVNSTGNLANGSVVPFIVGKENNFTFKWSNGVDSRNLTNVTAGSYCLTITDTNGCSTVACFDLKSTVSASDKNTGEEIEILPNPVRENLYLIKKGSFRVKETLLYSDKGQLILNYSYLPEQLDLVGIPVGWYFLKITTENDQVFFRKVVKVE